MRIDPASALGNLPPSLRSELLEEFNKITRNYREGRWEASELNGGRFCEIVYSIIAGHLDGGNYPDKAKKPSRFKDACERLSNAPTTYPESARLTIPRVLVPLYDVRNRRGVGHVGGEVDANHMDATFVLHTAQWLMAELVRIFHKTDIATAGEVVKNLIDRTVPTIWKVGEATRILDPSMTLADGTLLLLYSEMGPQSEKVLAKNLEQNTVANYRRVLDRLHKAKLIEYERSTGTVHISPLGEKKVEERLLP
ncbi:hypothetical protein ACFQ6E_22995 [Streptomyces sp. NPDC056462]|uniref:hypothetical protein n=1 Tax=Streptomyces sp. NPDC056462 TaxID=3345826 RepID=UPI0036AEFC33